MNILQQVARRPERLEALDKVAKPLAGAAGAQLCRKSSSGQPADEAGCSGTPLMCWC